MGAAGIPVGLPTECVECVVKVLGAAWGGLLVVVEGPVGCAPPGTDVEVVFVGAAPAFDVELVPVDVVDGGELGSPDVVCSRISVVVRSIIAVRVVLTLVDPVIAESRARFIAWCGMAIALLTQRTERRTRDG